MENEKLKASCPVCGRNLFRGSENSCVEGYCPKCKSHIEVIFFRAGVKSMVITDTDENKQITGKQSRT